MVHRVTTSDNEYQRMTTSDYEWHRVIQRVITNNNDWQRVAQRLKTNESEWEQVNESDFGFRMKKNMQCITKYIQQYRLFISWDIDDIYFQYDTLCFYYASIFSFFFAISFVRRFFANTGILEKKTKNPREESIFDDPFEESITEDSKRTLSLRIIKRTSSLRNLKKN